LIFRIVLNVLKLLEEEPRNVDELFETGLFPRFKDLEWELGKLEEAGIIISHKRDEFEVVYALTALGTRLFEFYPEIHLKTCDLVWNEKVRKYVKLVQPTFPRQ
jgi:hypothetical protein